AGPGSEAVRPVRVSSTAASPPGPPRMMKKPAGPAYTLSRVMPRVWSWDHRVAARPVFGYWKTANPEPHVTPYRAAALAAKKSYQVPSVAKPLRLCAAGRYH